MSISDYLRENIKHVITRLKFLRRPSIAYCAANGLLPAAMVRTPSQTLRELFGLSSFEHESQLNQDIFALLMNRFEPGFFVEIGANDGTTLSNTVYLEECFGWQGILIEANPKYRTSLARRKRSKIVIKAVSSIKEQMEFIDAGLYGGMSRMLDDTYQQYTDECGRILVECEPLIDILKSCNAPDRIDFVSIDVEGMESTIVEQIANSSYRFKFGCVEHNFRPDKYEKMAATLRSANYRILWEGQTRQDMFFIDDNRNLEIKFRTF